MIGKKYAMTPLKLLKKNSNIENQNFDKRTFFCSELVAATYKFLNLLPNHISSCRYWPGFLYFK